MQKICIIVGLSKLKITLCQITNVKLALHRYDSVAKAAIRKYDKNT